MNLKELNNKKVPVVKIDRELNKLSKKILFPEKVELANEMLKTKGVPSLKAQK